MLFQSAAKNSIFHTIEVKGDYQLFSSAEQKRKTQTGLEQHYGE